MYLLMLTYNDFKRFLTQQDKFKQKWHYMYFAVFSQVFIILLGYRFWKSWTFIWCVFPFTDKDLFIFVAYCMFEDSIIGPSSSEPFVSLEDVHAFNLLRDDSYIDMVQEMGISSNLFQAPSLPSYRAQIESIV
jgi:hypothetical protein